MKLLLDQGLPRSVAVLLAERGFDTVHAGDVGLCRDDLASGAVVTVRGRSIRVRSLPVVARFR